MSTSGRAALGVLVPALLLLAFPACDFSLESKQEFDLTTFDAPGAILDIGGGGEGVIGQLKPDQVIAIDVSRDELEGAPAGPLKIVMDASDLKFVDESFDTATSFCTLMYIDEKVHERVFEEMFRVLTPGGSFHIWDIAIPRRTNDTKEKALFPVSVKMPGDDVSTAYGVRRRDMDLHLDYYMGLARKAGFDVVSREPSEQSFYLLLKKPADYVKPIDEKTAQDHNLKPSDEQI